MRFAALMKKRFQCDILGRRVTSGIKKKRFQWCSTGVEVSGVLFASDIQDTEPAGLFLIDRQVI